VLSRGGGYLVKSGFNRDKPPHVRHAEIAMSMNDEKSVYRSMVAVANQ
jgi:hypothetical protein